jgi:hypothetical protein
MAGAIQHFTTLCQRTFVSGAAQQRRLHTYAAHLQEYERQFRILGHTVVRTAVRMRIPLALHVNASAEISRIDMTQGAYAFCILIGGPSANWLTETRMPIMQHLVSRALNVPIEMISAGIYSLEDAAHSWHSFSRREVARALRDAEAIGRDIVAAARQLRYPLH